VHARAAWRRRERLLTEVSWHELREDVVSTCPLPAHDVFGRHKDAPVAALSTAGATSQAIELDIGFRRHPASLDRSRGSVE